MGTIPLQGIVVWKFKVPADGYAVRDRFYILTLFDIGPPKMFLTTVLKPLRRGS